MGAVYKFSYLLTNISWKGVN